VNLVGGLNPDLLRELRGDDGAQDGFLERFLLVYPECPRHAYRRVPIATATREAWTAVVNRLYDLTPEKASPWTPRVVTFSAEAGDHYEWTINQLRERTADGPLHSMGRKFETYLARLALVLHYLRWAENDGHDDAATIEDADVQTATVLLGYFIAQAERVV